MTDTVDTAIADRLRSNGLRPTRQRVALAELLLSAGPRHLTAEMLFDEARQVDVPVSLATIYNCLHQFTQAGLVREVVVDPGRSYFDTNVTEHHHFYHEGSGKLTDIPGETISLGSLPAAPDGMVIDRTEVIIRVREA